MPLQVAQGATIKCSFGAAPSALQVTPGANVTADKMPAATIMDSAGNHNVLPFGMCSSLSNPQVASATSAALGVLTPMPCVPLIVGPWKPGSSTVTIGKKPALTNNSVCNCAYGGVIQFANAGQTSTNTK